MTAITTASSPPPVPPCARAHTVYHSTIYLVVMSVYLLYMFWGFRTRFAVHHPFERLFLDTLGTTATPLAKTTWHDRIGAYFRHPIETSAQYGRKICRFGRHSVIALVVFLVVRWGLVRYTRASQRTMRRWSLAALVVGAVLSLLNMNAVLYMLPYFAVEAWVLAGCEVPRIEGGGGEGEKDPVAA